MQTTPSHQFKKLLSWADEQELDVDIFPRDIKELLSLVELNLHSKNIDYIPSEIGLLQNLQRLYLSDNNLVSIPKEIGTLVNLKSLWIQNNKIKILPDEILSLVVLEDLVAFDNMIERIPSNIANLVNLQAMFLHNNCISLDILESVLYPLKSKMNLSTYNQNTVHTYPDIAALFLQGKESDILIDKDDLTLVMNHIGVQIILNAEYIGSNSVGNVLKIALESQDNSSVDITTTKGVIVQFTLNPDYSIMEVVEAISEFHESFDNSDMLFCTLTDEKLADNYVAVTILLTGLLCI